MAQHNNNLHEFDHLLGEGHTFAEAQNAMTTQNRVVSVQRRQQQQQQQPQPQQPQDNLSHDVYKVELVSAVAAAPSADGMTVETVESTTEGESAASASEATTATTTTEYDPYAAAQMDTLQQKIQTVEAKKAGKLDFVKDMSMTDITIAFIIPSIALFAGARWGFNRFAEKFNDSSDEILDNYASEMIYHDGDFEEMKMCTKDYQKKLVFLGPSKKEIMLKRYLELYAKKKIVSPQSISSLSYVFTLYKLSEEKAAEILVSLCKKLGGERISSSGKLLFFGSHILKSPEGKAALDPIKDMIKDTYKDEETADAFVEASQTAMGEAAYRHAVQAGGKSQDKLTIGWEVLGLDKETATAIFEEEKGEGFITARETMYKGQTTKYDKKGNALDAEGNLADPENADVDDDDDDDSGAGGVTDGVYECGECGYTLFVAKGRDFKFFGDDFKCPECGAEKDKFVGRNIEE